MLTMTNATRERFNPLAQSTDNQLIVLGQDNYQKLEMYYGGQGRDPLRMQMNDLSAEHDWTAPYTVWMVFGECDSIWLSTFVSLTDKTSKIVWIDAKGPGSYGLNSQELDFLKTQLKEGKVQIITGDLVATRGEKFSEILDIIAMDDWQPIISKSTLQRQPEDAKQLIMSIAQGLNFKVLAKNTSDRVALKFLKNTLINAPLANLANPLKSLESICHQRPALIVATGPSLNKQLSLLKLHQDLFTIIAVDTAWPILNKHGIVPDFLVALDPISLPSWPENGLQDKLIVISDLICSPELVWSCLNHQLFSYSDPTIYATANKIGAVADPILTGGSVATQAFNLAIKMGANPVILIGQDLALTDGKDHAEGYLFKYDTNFLESQSSKGYDIKAYHGGIVRTEKQLLVYKNWYEQRIRSLPETTVINATEGGARIEGSLQLPFKTVCEEINKTNLRKISPVGVSAKKTVDKPHVMKLISNLEKIIQEVQNLGMIAHEGLALTLKNKNERIPQKNHLKHLRKIDLLNEKIKKIDPSIKTIVEVFDIKKYNEISQSALRSKEIFNFSQEIFHYRKIYQHIHDSTTSALDFLMKICAFYKKISEEDKFNMDFMNEILHELGGRSMFN